MSRTFGSIFRAVCQQGRPTASPHRSPGTSRHFRVKLQTVISKRTEVESTHIGSLIKVIMGGGRRNFHLQTESDPEGGENGWRDDMNLIEEWKRIKRQSLIDESKFSYITNQSAFDAIDPATTDYLFGLFESSHMQYEVDRHDDVAGEPSLAEMVEKSINLLKRSENGYFLTVEAGRIDHAHHDTVAQKAITDTWALSDAVQKAVDLTSEDDTLIVVTADHSHVFSMGGDTHIDNDLYGLAHFSDGSQPLSPYDGLPYFGLSYGNGPGNADHRNPSGGRENNTMIEPEQYNDVNFRQDTVTDVSSETHGGEDVGMYAHGPWSHLFTGTVEQNYLAHAMMFAGCLKTDSADHCDGSATGGPAARPRASPRTAVALTSTLLLLFQFRLTI